MGFLDVPLVNGLGEGVTREGEGWEALRGGTDNTESLLGVSIIARGETEPWAMYGRPLGLPFLFFLTT